MKHSEVDAVTLRDVATARRRYESSRRRLDRLIGDLRPQLSPEQWSELERDANDVWTECTRWAAAQLLDSIGELLECRPEMRIYVRPE